MGTRRGVGEKYDPEVWERLPFWVRETLKILDELREGDDGEEKTPSVDDYFQKRGGGGPQGKSADDEQTLLYQTRLDNTMHNSN